jgi:hypothetical protein
MSYESFSSLPPEEERHFVVYEQFTQENAKRATTIGVVAGIGFAVVIIGIVAAFWGSTPKIKFEEAEEEAAAAPAAAPAPAPTPAPAAAPAATPPPSDQPAAAATPPPATPPADTPPAATPPPGATKAPPPH